jgi:hypothetical protein
MGVRVGFRLGPFWISFGGNRRRRALPTDQPRRLGFVSGVLLLGVFVGIFVGAGVGGWLGLALFALVSGGSFALLLLREVRLPADTPEPAFSHEAIAASQPSTCPAHINEGDCPIRISRAHECVERPRHETWHECSCGYAWPLDATSDVG